MSFNVQIAEKIKKRPATNQFPVNHTKETLIKKD